MIGSSEFLVIFDNVAEGSETLVSQIKMLGFDELAKSKQMLILGGGDMSPEYPYMSFDYFLTCILRYVENRSAMLRINEIFEKKDKPYKFLFLNGRSRPHRKYLYERFKLSGLLDQSIWTMLDGRPASDRNLSLVHNDVNLMMTLSEIKWLDPKYEFHKYRQSVIEDNINPRSFVKHDLFSNEWGEIFLVPEVYIDSYFSLVTETVFDYPYSFRPEKTAKVLAMGHPWICATSPGWYRDLRNLGFKTFNDLIDEDFDQIDNHQDRMNRVHDIVQDLCSQNLDDFMLECEPICKYNQQHLIEFRKQHRQEFPDRFFDFISQHG
jgi:hypothetical protein